MGFPIRPIDMDDDRYVDLEETSLFVEDLKKVVDSIGTDDFQTYYLNIKQDLLEKDIQTIILFCRICYNKFSEMAEITFAPEPDFLVETDQKNIMDFLEFYHYNYIDFFNNLFIEMEVGIDQLSSPLFIQQFILKNEDKIILVIDKISKIYSYNWILSQFLRTYPKDKFINWIIDKVRKDKSLMISEFPIMAEN